MVSAEFYAAGLDKTMHESLVRAAFCCFRHDRGRKNPPLDNAARPWRPSSGARPQLPRLIYSILINECKDKYRQSGRSCENSGSSSRNHIYSNGTRTHNITSHIGCRKNVALCIYRWQALFYTETFGFGFECNFYRWLTGWLLGETLLLS